MDAHQLFKAGRLGDAIASLEHALRTNPSDQRSQTFLFELLCFAGDFDRAEHQLATLVQENRRESVLGTSLYKSVVHAEKVRQNMFSTRHFPESSLEYLGTEPTVAGKLNGKEFTSIGDSDPRIGPRLEIFLSGEYQWLPYSEISAVHVSAPRRLRDLLWIPARIIRAEKFKSSETLDVMIPSMAPLSWQHPDEEVRLGRVSDWCEDEAGDVAPYGLKTILVDREEIPVVEIRELELYPSSSNLHHT
jgi:type VI secretion system protein ImpE